MPRFDRVNDFQIDRNLGRCSVCPGAKWTKLNNLCEHEKLSRHRMYVKQKTLTAASNPPSSRPTQATVEDYFDGDDADLDVGTCGWRPDSEEVRSGPVIGAALSKKDSPLVDDLIAMLHAESLRSGTDLAGSELPPDKAAEMLQQALSGIDVVHAALWTDGDEAPDESDEDEAVDIGSSIRQAQQPLSAQEIADSQFGASRGHNKDYFPYPSLAMMKTDILFSSPRLRFSRAQQEAILSYAKELGAQNIPTLYALEKFQSQSKRALGDPTVKVEVPSGNIMYMNDPTKLLTRMYGHLPTRKLIHSLPELTPNKIKEVWQGSKWLKEVPDEVLTPMIRLGDKDFYINELTYCSDSRWFIPQRFFEYQSKLYAFGRIVSTTPTGLAVADEQSTQECSTFINNWPEISESNTGAQLFAPASQCYADRMPNPDRAIAQGLEWECPPIILFIDDVSGNSTKQWNVHYSSYMSHGGLPRAEIEKERNVQFVATSTHASPMEILHAICEAIKKTGGKTPLKVWDSLRQRYILLRPWLLFLPGDNPMQSEACSHIGLNANQICRCCHAGGTQEYKRSDNGFVSMMVPGRPRNTEETRNSVLSQLILATHAGADKSVKDAITSSGVKDSFAISIIHKLIALGKILRKSTATRKALTPEAVNQILTNELKKYDGKVVINPLLAMPGFDVHKDTPVEPLHTHLLGVVKYFWAQTVWVLDNLKKFDVFQAKLNSINQAGLNIPQIMADYMCHYRGGLIGKHFKTISQIMVFAIAGLVSDDLCNAWLAVGRLTVLIWQTDIDDVKTYQSLLLRAIQDVQDFAAALSPGILLTKSKIHIICHLPEHIPRFGPSPLLSTERYESFNRVFRLCSIHSNRQAPSRDIATSFANLERCRHIMTGGQWFDSQSQAWIQAGASVLRHLDNHPIDSRLLGVPSERAAHPGTVTLIPTPSTLNSQRREHRVSRPWGETPAHTLCPQYPPEAGLWNEGRTITTCSGDAASVGDEVLVMAEGGPYSPLIFASMVAILSPALDPGESKLSDTRHPRVLIRLSQLQPIKHTKLMMPVLSRSGEFKVITSEELHCVANVQHDCIGSGCSISGSKHLVQERVTIAQTKAVIQHKNTDRFVVNMHALHNNAAIRRALPADLQTIPTFYDDRAALHRTAAASLRDQKLQKKLAKEASARKQAETARRTLVTPTTVELDHLGDVAILGDMEETLEGPVRELEAAEEVSVVVQPRGPRGRRGSTPACGRGAGRGRSRGLQQVRSVQPVAGPSNDPSQRGDGRGRVQDAQPVPLTSGAALSGMPSLTIAADEGVSSAAAVGSGEQSSQPPRKRKRAVADPNEANRRENELRELFDKR